MLILNKYNNNMICQIFTFVVERYNRPKSLITCVLHSAPLERQRLGFCLYCEAQWELNVNIIIILYSSCKGKTLTEHLHQMCSGISIHLYGNTGGLSSHLVVQHPHTHTHTHLAFLCITWIWTFWIEPHPHTHSLLYIKAVAAPRKRKTPIKTNQYCTSVFLCVGAAFTSLLPQLHVCW